VQGQVTDLHTFECIEAFVQVDGENTRLQAIVSNTRAAECLEVSEASVWVPTLWHPWVAQRHRRKRHEMSQTRSGKGCQRHSALVTVNPCIVATNTGTLCNPFSATRKQPASNPYPKYIPKTHKVPPEPYHNGWQ
jgi:hypothetical protein